MRNLRFYKKKNKAVMCPNCGNLLAFADKDDPNVHKRACKRCNKWIWYYPNDDSKNKIKEIPNTRTSSGTRFY